MLKDFYSYAFWFANGTGFQVIKTTDSKVLIETLGDMVRVSLPSFWEITWNIQTGSVESWKV